MLDQRRAEERGYITLKEAAKLANYTPDYIGQLIRAGKIKGEQVYSQVAWVTTENEIQAYLADKARTVKQNRSFIDGVRNVSTFTMYGIVGICAVFLLFLQYILYVSIDAKLDRANSASSTHVTMHTEL